MSNTRLPELIPDGGIVGINVPAAEGNDCIVAMKLHNGSFVKIFSLTGAPCYEIIPSSIACYPIAAYFGTFSELWENAFPSVPDGGRKTGLQLQWERNSHTVRNEER